MREAGRPSMQQPKWGCGEPMPPRGVGRPATRQVLTLRGRGGGRTPRAGPEVDHRPMKCRESFSDRLCDSPGQPRRLMRGGTREAAMRPASPVTSPPAVRPVSACQCGSTGLGSMVPPVAGCATARRTEDAAAGRRCRASWPTGGGPVLQRASTAFCRRSSARARSAALSGERRRSAMRMACVTTKLTRR